MKRKAYRVQCENLKERPPRDNRGSWEDNIKINLIYDGEKSHLVYPVHDGVQRRALVNIVLDYRVTRNTRNFSGICGSKSLSRRSLLQGVIQSHNGRLL